MPDRHAFPIAATDARGQRIVVEEAPQRIISLVPSQTELLAHLGLDERVVGITRFCVHPKEWKPRKGIVGGTKQLNMKRIRPLAPDLVLANKEENTPEMVEALEAFAPVFVTDVADVPGALSMIRTVGRLTGTAPQADTLASAIDAGFAELRPLPPLRAAYLIWRRPYMTVGGDTFIHDVMSHGGLVNVFAEASRYPEVTLTDLAAAQPEVLLLASEPFPFQEQHFDEFHETLPDVPLAVVDGELFSWYGPRLLQTPEYLRELRERAFARP
jgi:ABC-type Fe3+-hydroxamate transport system substrate-binding protein